MFKLKAQHNSVLQSFSRLFCVYVVGFVLFYVVLSGECKLPVTLPLTAAVACRCRRSTIAVHFDEVWDDEDCNQMCDICRQGNGKTLIV